MMENKIQDPVFGELIWEENYRNWSGKVKLPPNLTVEVNLEGDREQVAESMAGFGEIFEHLRQMEGVARNFAAEKLLKLYNESWRDDDEPIINEQVFCQRIRPERFVIHEDKSADLYYQTTICFWGT